MTYVVSKTRGIFLLGEDNPSGYRDTVGWCCDLRRQQDMIYPSSGESRQATMEKSHGAGMPQDIRVVENEFPRMICPENRRGLREDL